MKERICAGASTAFSAIAVMLESLPWGAVLNFANPEGDAIARTYSYFSLVPYGYANFAPFLCAVCSAMFLGLTVVSFFVPRKVICTAALVLGGLSLFLCALSLISGNLTLVSVGIFLSILCALLFSFIGYRLKFAPKSS